MKDKIDLNEGRGRLFINYKSSKLGLEWLMTILTRAKKHKSKKIYREKERMLDYHECFRERRIWEQNRLTRNRWYNAITESDSGKIIWTENRKKFINFESR